MSKASKKWLPQPGDLAALPTGEVVLVEARMAQGLPAHPLDPTNLTSVVKMDVDLFPGRVTILTEMSFKEEQIIICFSNSNGDGSAKMTDLHEPSPAEAETYKPSPLSVSRRSDRPSLAAECVRVSRGQAEKDRFASSLREAIDKQQTTASVD